MLNKFMNPLKIKPLLIAVASLSALSLLSCKQGETSEPVPRMLTTFASSATHSAGGKHALLIGIQEYNYVQTGFHSLKGPLNDINLTKGMLGQRFGFQEQDLITLTDAQATHTGIENAFQKLIQRINPGDFVYIYYTGHGSQTADLNGDELEGKDQTWVAYGARTRQTNHKDNYDVLDDEINAWLGAIYAKTDQVVFVSDSCHSATVSKGFNLTRALDFDERPHILGRLKYTQPQIERGIRIGAARDYESAIDKARTNGRHYGAFTWHWVHNLQQAQASDTWYTVFQRTYAQLTAERGVAQRPQIEGERRQQILGGGRFFTAQPATLPVTVINNNWIELKAGFLSGVTQGSVYRQYQPQHPNPNSLPRLTITDVDAFTSYGKPERGTFQTGDLVVEKSHAYHFKPIKVALEAAFPNGKDRPLLQRIQAAFRPDAEGELALPAYRLINDPADADIRLQLLRPKRRNGQFIRAKANDALPQSFPEQPAKLWVLTPEQRLLYNKLQMAFHNPTRGIELLEENLNKLARVRELKALQSSRGSQLPVGLQAYVLSPVSFCQPGPNCRRIRIRGLNQNQYYRKTKGPYRLQELEKQTMNQEEIITFTLHNQSEWVDYYCYIFNISPTGAISSIFPKRSHRPEAARLDARKTRELMEVTGLFTEDVGEETLKFMTSLEPIDVALLEQGPFKGRAGAFNPLERLLFAHAVHGERGQISLDNDEWATGLVAFDVK